MLVQKNVACILAGLWRRPYTTYSWRDLSSLLAEKVADMAEKLASYIPFVLKTDKMDLVHKNGARNIGKGLVKSLFYEE